MKNTLSLFKNFLLAAIVLIFLNSCESDTPALPHTTKSTSTTISFSQFKKETQISNFATVFKTKTVSLGEKARTAVTAENFVVDTTSIEKRSDSDPIYSFFVYPVNHETAGEHEIFNLVYHKENSKWETSLFSMEIKAIEGSHAIYENIKQLYSSNNRNMVCWGTEYKFHCTRTGPCAGGTCDLCSLCVSSSAIPVPCGTPEPEDPGIGTGGDPGFGINPGGGGIPVKAFMTALQLDLTQQAWLNANPFFKVRLIEGYIGVPSISAVADIRDEFKAKLHYMMEHYDMCQSIAAFVEQQQYREEAQKLGWEMVDLAMLETNQADVNNLTQLTLLVENSGDTFFTDDFAESLIPYIDVDGTIDEHFPGQLVLQIYSDYRKLRVLNPEWSKAKCKWHALKGVVHISLDAFGLIPVGGEVADLVNGVLYTIEGDNINATLSYASAVPIAGWATIGVKYSFKIVNRATDINSKVKLVWKVMPNNKIFFGSDSYCRSQLRKILGLAVGNINQAHHIIPLNLQTNEVVQRAARSGNAFHLNEALNGIPLSRAVHNGSHGAYNSKITQKLDDFIRLNPNATPNQCYTKVNDIILQIRIAIQNNPNTSINQLNF